MLYLGFIIQPRGVKLGRFPREQISTLYLRFYRLLNWTLMLYLGLFMQLKRVEPGHYYLSQESRSQNSISLSSIPKQQITLCHASQSEARVGMPYQLPVQLGSSLTQTSFFQYKIYPHHHQYLQPSTSNSSIALPKNSYSMRLLLFYISCYRKFGTLYQQRCGNYYI